MGVAVSHASRRRRGLSKLFHIALVCGGSTIAVSAASAQEAPKPDAPVAAPVPSSTPTKAQPSDQSSSAATSPEEILRDIVVTGHSSVGGGNMIAQREPVTASSVSSRAIAERAAITGPLQIIASLPGIATAQSDPFAMSQRSFVFVRGLPSGEIGWLLEEMPVVDQAFFLPYSETFADPENLAGMTVIPGSSRIVDPVQTAVGGEIIATVRNPAEKAGGFLEYSHGSYRANRVFGRVDTGDIGDTGLRAFLSGSYTSAGTFNLPGTGNRTHVDFKAEKDWGGASKSTLFLSYTDWSSERSNSYTLASFAAAKAANDYTIGNFAPTYTPGVTTNYYKLGYYFRKNIILSLKNEIHLSDRLALTVTPYYHWTKSNSTGQSSINPASTFNGTNQVTVNTTGLTLYNGRIPVMSSSYQDHYALGVNAFLKYDVSDSNQLLVGYWHDYWHLYAINNFNKVDANGNPASTYAEDENAITATDGTVVAGLRYRMHSNIDVVSVGDQQKLLDDRLTLEVGIKYFHKSLSGVNLLPGAQTTFSGTFDRFLPRASFAFDMTPKVQVYGNVIASLRPPVPINIYPNTYNVSNGAIAQLSQPATGPEKGLGEELGFRYHDDLLTVDIAAFNKVIKNRQIGASAFLNGAGVSTTLIAGTEKVRGITGEVGLAPIHGFSPYANFQYLRATTESDFFTGTDYLPTKGKTATISPKWTAAAGLNYRNGGFFANALFKYTASQYATLMNDEVMPGYHTIDLGVGYKLPHFLGQDTAIKLNVTNVENKPYLGSLSAPTPNAKATVGRNGTTIAGSTPLYLLSSPRSILLTISSSF